MIRKISFLFLIFLISIIIKAGTNRLLIIETTEGVRVSFALSESPEFTFNGKTMIVTSDNRSQQFEVYNIIGWYFENETTSVNSKEGFIKPSIARIVNEELIIEGLPHASNVQIYSIDGRKQSNQISLSDGEKSIINISSLPKGVYIVSINKQQNIKISKK